jgi:hypothetical protein
MRNGCEITHAQAWRRVSSGGRRTRQRCSGLCQSWTSGCSRPREGSSQSQLVPWTSRRVWSTSLESWWVSTSPSRSRSLARSVSVVSAPVNMRSREKTDLRVVLILGLTDAARRAGRAAGPALTATFGRDEGGCSPRGCGSAHIVPRQRPGQGPESQRERERRQQVGESWRVLCGERNEAWPSLGGRSRGFCTRRVTGASRAAAAGACGYCPGCSSLDREFYALVAEV